MAIRTAVAGPLQDWALLLFSHSFAQVLLICVTVIDRCASAASHPREGGILPWQSPLINHMQQLCVASEVCIQWSSDIEQELKLGLPRRIVLNCLKQDGLQKHLTAHIHARGMISVMEGAYPLSSPVHSLVDVGRIQAELC